MTATGPLIPRHGGTASMSPAHGHPTVMNQICIPVPMPAEDVTLELEVTVGGTTPLMAYRIETVT